MINRSNLKQWTAIILKENTIRREFFVNMRAKNQPVITIKCKYFFDDVLFILLPRQPINGIHHLGDSFLNRIRMWDAAP